MTKEELGKMKQIINDFINSIDTKLYIRIRASKSDAECRRYLKEHLQKQLRIGGVSNSVRQEIERRRDMILSEPDGIVRKTMINNLTLDL